MSCNTCAKPYTLLRKEKGCPSCGFSYCSKCLNEKMFVQKLGREAKVCARCKRSSKEPQKIQPPEIYFKRLAEHGNERNDDNQSNSNSQVATGTSSSKDQEIIDRLKKLKEYSKTATPSTTEDIEKRLQKIKREVPKTTDQELQERLAKLKGLPISDSQKQPLIITHDLRTEQEQIDDLMKEFQEKVLIESKYKEEFDTLVSDIENRLSKLKEAKPSSSSKITTSNDILQESEDEEDTVQKILAKVKAEALFEDEIPPPTNDELPFCEICNEDATMRCLGCRYLFCKQCYTEHIDDDDGCNRYEPYKPPEHLNN